MSKSFAEDDALFGQQARAAGVPHHVIDGLSLYVLLGIQPGHFLTAVLENDLRESFARADEECRRGLFALVCFLYNGIPARAWGSPERVEQWLDTRSEVARVIYAETPDTDRKE